MKGNSRWYVGTKTKGYLFSRNQLAYLMKRTQQYNLNSNKRWYHDGTGQNLVRRLKIEKLKPRYEWFWLQRTSLCVWMYCCGQVNAWGDSRSKYYIIVDLHCGPMLTTGTKTNAWPGCYLWNSSTQQLINTKNNEFWLFFPMKREAAWWIYW